MILSFIKVNWLDLTTSLGVFASLVVSSMAYGATQRTEKIRTAFTVSESHARVWNHLINHPQLARIRLDEVDLDTDPITPEEERIVLLVLVHVTATLHAIRSGQFEEAEAHRADIANFFSKPIPSSVYVKHKRLLENILIEFLTKEFQSRNRTGSQLIKRR